MSSSAGSATDATTTARTFSPTVGATELQKVEMSYITHLRSGSGYGNYAKPQVYALNRIATTTPGAVNLLQMDYWPGTTGYYFPMQYVPQFTPIDSATVTTPALPGRRFQARIDLVGAAPRPDTRADTRAATAACDNSSCA